MKRRLFLKTSGVGIGGIIALPTVIYGCATLNPIPIGPSMSASLFQEGSRLFDSSIAELRLSGSGELASAEAEDPTGSGTGAEVDLAGVAEQITLKKAAVPAELAEDFAESSSDMLKAAGTLFESAPEMFPLNNKVLQAELADDYALLKVVKASSLLASAAMATPRPVKKVTAAEKMISSAEMVHKAMIAGSESELINYTESLLAHSEEYVGVAEQFSARPAFIEGVETFEGAIQRLKAGDLVNGVADLLTSSDNIALSSGYYADGINNLNAAADILNGSQITAAEELTPFTSILVSATPQFELAAKGLSAEMGAEKMVSGSETLHSTSISNVELFGDGGKVLDHGADQFIGGEITYNGAQSYNANSDLYISASESFSNSNNALAEAEHIEGIAEVLLPASVEFYNGAKSLQSISLTEGVENLVPAAENILQGAELLQSEAENPTAKKGADKMINGAVQALTGASQSENNPAEFLESGSESVELGTLTVLHGAEQFVEGYK